MQPLSAAELLAVWEQGLNRTPARWALAVLAAADPETPATALGQLPVGARDSRLLALREWLFGSRLVGLAACPACVEQLELDFHADDIRALPAELPGELNLTLDDYELRFRLPNGLDLAALSEQPAADPWALFERCLLDARRGGVAQPVGALPDEVLVAAGERMAAADPQADVQLALRCPACDHAWEAPFDIAAFLWNEVNAWAARLLAEVHRLAWAYGWREADILAMSPQRRYAYLELIGNRN